MVVVFWARLSFFVVLLCIVSITYKEQVLIVTLKEDHSFVSQWFLPVAALGPRGSVA